MKESNSRREFLSQSGKMVTAAALFGTSVPLAHAAVAGTLNCEANNTMKITDPHYYLDNVLLETGFDYENGVAVQSPRKKSAAATAVSRPARRARPWRFRTAKLSPCARTSSIRTPRCRTMTLAVS